MRYLVPIIALLGATPAGAADRTEMILSVATMSIGVGYCGGKIPDLALNEKELDAFVEEASDMLVKLKVTEAEITGAMKAMSFVFEKSPPSDEACRDILNSARKP